MQDEASQLISYKVTTAETLSSVAAKHGTTPQKIARLNRITSSYVFPGQTLIINKSADSTPKIKHLPKHPRPSTPPRVDPILFETPARHVTTNLGFAGGNIIVTVKNMYFDAELDDYSAVTYGLDVFRIEESIANLISLSTFSHLPQDFTQVIPSQGDFIYVRLRFLGGDYADEFWLQIQLPGAFEFQRHLLLASSCSSAITSSAEEMRCFVRVGTVKKVEKPCLVEDYFYHGVSGSSNYQKTVIDRIFENVPPRVCCEKWRVLFSTESDGYSLMRLIRAYKWIERASLIVIQDVHDQVFGIYLSHPLEVSKLFCGNGETYLFSFYPDFRIYRWSGGNDYFIKCSQNELIFGASDGHYGLWIDDELCHGSTSPCSTFDNQKLTTCGDFVIKNLEVWSY